MQKGQILIKFIRTRTFGIIVSDYKFVIAIYLNVVFSTVCLSFLKTKIVNKKDSEGMIDLTL